MDYSRQTSPRSGIAAETGLIMSLLILLTDGGTSALSLVSSLAVLLLCMFFSVKQDSPPSLAGTAFTAFMVLAFLTTVPLPDSLLKIAGIEAGGHHLAARNILIESSQAGLISPAWTWFQISRNAAGTARAVLLLATAISAAYLSRQLAPHRVPAMLMLFGLAAALTGLSGLASIHMFPQGKTFWWSIPVLHGTPVACFINRNHFGSFTACAGAVMPGLACYYLNKSRRLPAAAAGAAFIICTAAVAGSFSRGAMLSFLAGIIAAVILSIRRAPRLTVILVTTALVFSSAVLLPGAGGEGLRKRMASSLQPHKTQSAILRLDTWRDAVSMFPRYPLLGTGLNGFRSVFPQHRQSSTRKEPNNVENEYIQIPVESGAAGALLMAAAFVIYITSLLRKKNDPEEFAWVAVPGLVVAAAHAMVDFSLRIPLCAILTSVLAGAALRRPPLLKRASAARLVFSAFTATALAAMIQASVKPESVFEYDSPDFLNSAGPEDIAKAIASSPSYWHAYYNLGRHAARRDEMRTLAERNISAAARLDPLNYNLLVELSLLRLDLGQREKALESYRRAKHIRSWLNIKQLEELLIRAEAKGS